MFGLSFNTLRTSHEAVGQNFTDTSKLPPATYELAYLTRDVLPGKGGRLHYLGTEWGAIALDNTFIPEGTPVRPIVRRGNRWLVVVDAQYQDQVET